MAALGFLKNWRDPCNVASIGKGAVSFLGDPSPWEGFCGEKSLLDWEFWRQQRPLLHGINHLPASDLCFIPCPGMGAQGRGESGGHRSGVSRSIPLPPGCIPASRLRSAPFSAAWVPVQGWEGGPAPPGEGGGGGVGRGHAGALPDVRKERRGDAFPAASQALGRPPSPALSQGRNGRDATARPS